MRRNLLMMLAISLIGCTTFTACGSDDEEIDPRKNVEVTTMEQQKSAMDSIAKSFIDQLNAEDFAYLNGLSNHFNYNLRRQGKYDQYDNDIIRHIEEVVDATKVPTTTDDLGIQHFDRFYKLSLMNGHYAYVDGQWTYSESGDLTLEFPDQNGDQLKISVTHSEKGVTFTTENMVERSYENDNYHGKKRIESMSDNDVIGFLPTAIYQEYAVIPNEINMKVQRAGKQIIDATMTTSAKIGADKFLDPMKDEYGMTLKFKYLSYNFNIDRLQYKNNAKSEAKFSILKDGTSLFTLSFDGVPMLNENSSDVQKLNMEMNMMNAMRMKGSVPYPAKVMEVQHEISMSNNQTTISNLLEILNKNFDVDIYFNGSQKATSSLVLVPLEYEYDDEVIYLIRPALQFRDGSTYTVSEFFETGFDDLIAHFMGFYSKVTNQTGIIPIR